MTHSSQARPVFIAALRREIASMVTTDGWEADDSKRARNTHVFSSRDAIVACAGMGTSRASLAIEAALALGPASELVSVGWAGACDSRFKVGDIIHPTIVIDARTGERFFLSEPATTEAAEIVVTVPSPAGIVTKQRLAINYRASAVDMEAAAVARAARARELPCSIIKAISDDADFELPDMQQFSTSDGQFREAAFGLHVALRPGLWSRMLALANGSRLAAERLRVEIEAHILEHRDRKI